MKRENRSTWMQLALLTLLLPTLASAQGLTFTGAQFDGVGGVEGLAGPRIVAVSPDGANAYVAGEGDNSIAVFARDRSTGDLSFLQAVTEGVDGVEGLVKVSGVAVSNDGRNVYTSSAGEPAVAVFARDPSTGALSFVEVQREGVDGVSGLGTPGVGVALSPNGLSVYVVASGRTDSVIVFERDPSDGTLSFVETEKDGVNGVEGLNGAFGTAVSPDGRHVYVNGINDSAIAVFSRSPLDGSLSFVEAEVEGVDGVQGLAGARFVAVSPNGKHVYAVGLFSSSIAIFSRDRKTGELEFQEAVFDGVDGVTGLGFPVSIAVSPNGSRVYAVGFFGSVAVFDRDRASGSLTFVEAELDGVNGVDGIAGSVSVTTSQDGDNVYVVGFDDSGLATFDVD